MTTLTLRFYRLDTATSPDGGTVTEKVEVRPPIDYDSVNPAPGTEVKIKGFPPCRCPQSPACTARENKSKGAAVAPFAPVPEFPPAPSPAAGAAHEETPALAGV